MYSLRYMLNNSDGYYAILNSSGIILETFDLNELQEAKEKISMLEMEAV